jgi:hypothetical protein
LPESATGDGHFTESRAKLPLGKGKSGSPAMRLLHGSIDLAGYCAIAA